MVGAGDTAAGAGIPGDFGAAGESQRVHGRVGDHERVRAHQCVREVWDLLGSVPDPEIPVLSVVDLGIVRHVRWSTGEDARSVLHVGITPTYSGCPATEVIRHSIETALDQEGYVDAIVEEVLSPAWTSDWLTEEGRRKLESFGIAPPEKAVSSPRHLFRAPVVTCPRCASRATERVSEFGSTPCKAHYRCTSCLEPFDYFKCL